MTTKQCDKCQQAIDYPNEATIRIGRMWRSIELCLNCAQPVVEILKKYEIFEDSVLKNLPTAKEAV
jgi:hypothetical protein